MSNREYDNINGIKVCDQEARDRIAQLQNSGVKGDKGGAWPIVRLEARDQRA